LNTESRDDGILYLGAALRRPDGVRVCHRHGARFTTGMTGRDEPKLLARITVNPAIFGGKPIIRGHRLAVEHVLEMLAVGDAEGEILAAHPWLEPDDIRACLLYAARSVGNEHLEPLVAPS
jgi:uncharacterized protein (DUF433 family)